MNSAKIALICSAGGHFLELYALKESWRNNDCFWMTFPAPDTQHLLLSERVYFAHHPTNRHLPNLFRNLRMAWGILRQEKPGLIISTGAGVAVPFFWLGWLMGIKTIYLEDITLSENISLTGRLVYPIADEFLVQSPELCRRYPRSRFYGQVL